MPALAVFTMANPMRTSIGAAGVPALLLGACPSFAEACEEVREGNEDPEGEAARLGHLDAGAFIQHLCSLHLEGDVEEFPPSST